MIKTMLLAGAGGFAGTCLRYLVKRWCETLWPGTFPTGTFVVNLAGCLAIGLLLGLSEKHGALSGAESALLTVGFCGGFTTFSTYADDLYKLMEGGEWGATVTYAVLSTVLGVGLVIAGRLLMK